MKRLSIGGEFRRDGWVTVNADPNCQVDIIAAVPPLPKEVMEVRWNEVEALHTIEHVYKWEAEEIVAEVYKILDDGGQFIVELPDISYCMKVFLGMIQAPPRGKEHQFDLWGIYGDWNHRNPWYMHKHGYTPQSLTDLFVGGGFDRSKVFLRTAESHYPVRDFRLVGVK